MIYKGVALPVVNNTTWQFGSWLNQINIKSCVTLIVILMCAIWLLY